MNNLLKYVAYGIGAFVLFIGSFLAFASFSDAPMNGLPLIGGMFPQPPEAPGPEKPEAEAPGALENVAKDARPAEEVVAQATLPLHAFVLESPLPAAELGHLQAELKSLIRSNELRALELDQHEKELQLRAQHYDERWAELETMRSSLMRSELELEARQTELDRDDAAKAAKEKASWKSVATTFLEGKTKVLVPKLLEYPAPEAAKILRAMPEARAAELLAEIPSDRYVEYSEAYRKAE
jgi:hypothetical protein